MTTCLAFVCLIASAAPAQASYPGVPGKIVIQHWAWKSLWSMNPDGTDFKEFINVPGVDGSEGNPAWSADGQKIAFEHPHNSRWPNIWTANADGSNLQKIITDAHHPSWSPDGQRITFARDPIPGQCCWDIFVADADGTDQVNITQTPQNENEPEWSPDGEHIALWGTGDTFFYELRLIKPTGGPQTLVAAGSGSEWSPFGDELIVRDLRWGDQRYRVSLDGSQRTLLVPERTASPIGAWSPDGTEIAFFSLDDGLSMVSYDGTSRGPIENPPEQNSSQGIAWQPLPQPAAPRYVRPKGATPLYASLVPAYRPCTTPNRTHGTPLAFGSCAPSQQASTSATVGTPDANARAARSTGFVRLDALPGNPANPADEADAAITVHLSDVRNKADLSDYGHTLTVPVSVRLTYRGASGDQATMREPAENTALFYSWPLRAIVPCTATADPGVGSTCSVATTAEAIVGGNAVREGERAIWALDQVRVFDAGPDQNAATTEDNERFAVQGVFVP